MICLSSVGHSMCIRSRAKSSRASILPGRPQSHMQDTASLPHSGGTSPSPLQIQAIRETQTAYRAHPNSATNRDHQVLRPRLTPLRGFIAMTFLSPWRAAHSSEAFTHGLHQSSSHSQSTLRHSSIPLVGVCQSCTAPGTTLSRRTPSTKASSKGACPMG